jgi:hypothetical protein
LAFFFTPHNFCSLKKVHKTTIFAPTLWVLDSDIIGQNGLFPPLFSKERDSPTNAPSTKTGIARQSGPS